MKIPLNIGRRNTAEDQPPSGQITDRDLTACKNGDWEAKSRVIQSFIPLLTSLAKQRTTNTAAFNAFLEAGKEGLMIAIRKYRTAGKPDKFQIFALDFIEKAMDGVGQKKGFFARLFGRRGRAADLSG